jgi:putative membrane protein
MRLGALAVRPASRRRAIALILCFATNAYAHAGHHHELKVSEVAKWWSWEPVTIALLLITAIWYAIGAIRVPHATRYSLLAGGGWLTLVIALISPIDTLGGILFSAHMTQHELLMMVAAPLMVLGRPLVVFLCAFPMSWRTKIGAWTQTHAVASSWRFITGPLVVTILHAIALWIWHLPSLYQMTLRSEPVHAFQHLSFFLTAALFWWALIHGRYGRMGYGVAVSYVFFTAAHSGILGALIAFAPTLIYPIYQATTAQWGLDAIEDQQLAGILMWIPAGVIFTIVGVALFAGWLREAERRVAFTRSEQLRKEQA